LNQWFAGLGGTIDILLPGWATTSIFCAATVRISARSSLRHLAEPVARLVPNFERSFLHDVGSNFTKRYANKTRRQFYAKNIVSEYRGDTFEANIPFLGKLFGHPGFFFLLSIQVVDIRRLQDGEQL